MKSDLKLQLMIFHGASLILCIGIIAALKMSVPLLGLALIVSPALVALFTRNYGMKFALILVLSLTVLLSLLPTSDWLNTLCFFGPLGIVLGEKRLRVLPGAYQVGIGLVSTLAGSILWYNVISFLNDGQDLLKSVIDELKQSIANDDIIATIQQIYGELPQGFESEVVDLSLKIMPSMLFIMFLIFVIVNIFFVGQLSRITRKSEAIETISLELPQEILNLATVLLLGSLLVNVFDESLGSTMLQNCIIMLMFVFSIQGIIVINHFLKTNKVNSVLRFFIIIIAIVFLQIFGLSILGWLDLLIGIRRRFVGQ